MATSANKFLAVLAVTGAVFTAITPVQAQSVWDGGGANNNWRTAENWVGDVVPTPGSVVVFDGSSRFTPNNDFAAGTAFSGITFATTAAGPFALNGSSINLTGNITDNTQSFTHTISLPLALQITPTIDIADLASLTIGSVISGGFGLNETGSGLLTLSGANTFTGPVTIGNGATLSISNDNNLGAGSSLAINDGGTLKTTANVTLSSSRGLALGPGIATLDTRTGTTLTYNGVIADNGGTGGLAKLSFGNLTLGGANTYSGTTAVKNGTLTLDFTQATAPASNIINSASALTMGGATAGLGQTSYAQLVVTGKASATSSQTFNGTTIDIGPAVIRANSGTGGTANLSLGAITVNKGGIATFVLPTTGNITTTTNNVNGILGAWATVGTGADQNNVIYGTDWATVDGSGNVQAYTGYTAWSLGNLDTQGFPSSANVQVTNGASLAVAADNANTTVDINTLALKNTAANQAISIGIGNTLRFGAVGGILRQDTGNNVTMYLGETGSSQHNQGFITAGGTPNTPGTLIVTVDANSESAGAVRIGAIIADNGTGKLTFVKSGPGNVKIDGQNTYTGDTYLLQGRTQMSGAENGGVANPTAFGFGKVFVFPGAMLAAAGNQTVANDMFLAGQGTGAEGIGVIRLGNGTVLSGTITLIGDARIGDGHAGTFGSGTAAITGKITGAFSLDLGSTASTGGTNGSEFSISNPLNDYTGNTTLIARTGTSTPGSTIIHLGNDEVIPNGIGKGNLIVGFNGVTTNSTFLDLNGHNETVNGVITPSGQTANITFIENLAASTTATLTLGDNNQTATFNGIIQDNPGTVAITKIGTGVQTFGGANLYTGDTNINNGAISVTGSLATTGNVLVKTSASTAGSLFGGSGTTAGVVGNVALLPATGSNHAVVNPGATGAGSTGILNMTSLTVGAGSNLQFDLGSPTTPGGTFDQVVVSGTVTFNGASIVTPSGLVAGNYVVIDASATGSITGTNAPSVVSAGDTRLSYASGPGSWDPVSNASSKQIVVSVSGNVADLTWSGATNSTWDLHNTPNWTSTAPSNPNLFFNGDNVTFDDTGANRDIAVGGNLQPGNMVFNSSLDYSVTGGGSLGGTGSLTKSGTGTLTLGTSNTFSGGVTLNAGTLVIANANALGSGSTFTISGGTLANTSGQNVTLATNPAQTWAADINYTGPDNLNLGTGAVTQTNLGSGINRTVTVSAGTLTVGGGLSEGSGNNGLEKQGAGTLALLGNGTFTGSTTVSAGTLRVGSSAALGGALVINATPTNGANTIMLPSTTGLATGMGVSGAGIPAGAIITAIDTGTNTITISANATAGNAADLTFATNTTAITVANGAALDVGGSTTANSIVIGPRAISIIGDGVAGSGALTNSSGTAQQNAFQSVTLTGDASFGGTGRFDIRGPSTTLNLNGFTLTKNGTNFVALANTAVNNGNIVVSQGTLELNAATSVAINGADTITISPNATLQFFALTGSVARPIVVNGPATISDGSGAGVNSSVASNITLAGDVTLNGGNATANLTLNGTLTESPAASGRAVTKTGAGTITLASTSNSYSGPTNLNAGLLNFAALGSLGSGTQLNFNGGGLQYAVNMASPPDLSVRTITFGAGGGTIDTNGNGIGTPIVFANGIGNNGSGGFTKAGDGTLTLNGASTYTGTTTVSKGTLVLGVASSFPTNGGLAMGEGTLDVSGHDITVSSLTSVGTNPTAAQIGSSSTTVNSTLTYAGGVPTSTYSGAIADSVNGGFGRTTALTVSTGTLALAGFNSYNGATTINSGATLQLGNGPTSSVGLGNTAITNNGTLVFNTSSLTVSNSIVGTGKVTQAGGSTSLSGAKSYSGGTELQGGTLSISSDAAINNGVGGITFSGGTLELNNYSSNLAFNNGNVSIGSQGTSTVSSGITTSGNFTAAGPGTLVVSGTNTYAGNTTVAGGTLQLGASNKLPSSTNLTLIGSGGAIFSTGGFSQTLGNLTLGGTAANSTIDLGAGSSILHFANSSLPSWGTNTLFINNWSGSNSGGGTDQVFFGTNNYSGLSHAQLNSITFANAATSGAILLATGELVPNPSGPTLPLPVLGDFDGNGSVTSADVTAMLTALTDLSVYQASHQLSDADLLATADVNNSGTITNADIQAELDLPGIGAGAVSAVPEPATWLLVSLGGLGLLGLRSRQRRLKEVA